MAETAEDPSVFSVHSAWAKKHQGGSQTRTQAFSSWPPFPCSQMGTALPQMKHAPDARQQQSELLECISCDRCKELQPSRSHFLGGAELVPEPSSQTALKLLHQPSSVQQLSGVCLLLCILPLYRAEHYLKSPCTSVVF